MLREQELKTFVDGATRYFEVAAQQPAELGSPYLVSGVPPTHDYSGVIGISGKREGIVYFTAPRAMLTVVLMKLQQNDFSHENMCEVVSEVAQAICGHARRGLGSDCMISAPTVVHGEGVDVSVIAGKRSFVIPINWRSHSAKLVVALK